MEYTYFTFDGVSSKKYNLIIENGGEDLTFPSQPDFDNQITSPLYQDTSYLMGVNKKDRSFNLKCWIDRADRGTINAIIDWLSVDKIGDLVFDYNPNFKYKVKVKNLSDFMHFAVNEDAILRSYTESYQLLVDNKITVRYEPENIIRIYNIDTDTVYTNYTVSDKTIQINDVGAAVGHLIRVTYMAYGSSNTSNYGFSVSFTTIGDFAAISRSDYRIFRDTTTNYVLELDGLTPIGFYDEITNEIKIFNYHDLPTWLDINLNNVKNFTLIHDGETYYNYTNLDTLGPINLNTRFGIAKIDDKLIEQIWFEENIDATSENNGPLLIKPGNTKVSITKIGRDI